MIGYKDLRTLLSAAQKTVERWNVSAEPMVQWHGSLRKCLSEDVHNAFESLASVAGKHNDEIHANARPLVMFIDAFAAKWIEFTDLARAGAMVDPAGTPKLWSAYTSILDNLETPKFKAPEPIEQLVRRENVPSWQVAKLYGWGNDTAKVMEELEKPGTHYNASWVHPEQVKFDAEIEAKWSKRKPLDLPPAYADLPGEQVVKAVAPESLETLIQQRVPVDQIAKMKGMSIEEVEQSASEMGIALAGARFVRPATQAGIIQEKLANDESRESEYERSQNAKSEAKPESKPANADAKLKAAAGKRYKELRTSGKSPAEISEAMKQEFPTLQA